MQGYTDGKTGKSITTSLSAKLILLASLFILTGRPAPGQIAARFIDDRDIASHPAVLVFTDFEDDSWKSVWDGWGGSGHPTVINSNDNEKFVPLSGKALQASVPEGQHTGLNMLYRFMEKTGEEPEEIYFRYYVRFGDGWSPSSDGKLPGIAGTYGKGGWGGRPSDGTNGWSARGLFHRTVDDRVPVGNYVYHTDIPNSVYGQHFVWEINDRGYLEKNRWYCVEMYIKLNTPKKNDGILRGWIDGDPAYERTNLRFRDTPDLKIETIWLNLYHGGSPAAPSDQVMFIDNIVIAREYIGPMPMFPAEPAAQNNQYDAGQFYRELQEYADGEPMRLSYLSGEWPELEQWRILGRAKMQELLSYTPEPAPLNAEITGKAKKDGYTRYTVRYSITPYRTTEAFLLIPDGLTEPAPAVIAMHDHGGFYYFGKEKITETENQPQILKDFIGRSYGGRTFADELARRGFVVLCPDAFYFGSQRLDDTIIPERFTRNYQGLGSDDINRHIRAFNQFSSAHENIMARYIFGSGTTWPGILFHGDRVSVDYLLSRPEVDPERIGVMGLSIGGFRSAHLFGLDHRIKAGVNAGWMTSYSMQIDNHLRNHTWMIYVPRQLQYLDLPDVVTLNAPRPLMIINCEQDQLYTMDAMQSAADKIEMIYEKMGAAGKFQTRWYDVPHLLNIEMQDDAIGWLEKWLK